MTTYRRSLIGLGHVAALTVAAALAAPIRPHRDFREGDPREDLSKEPGSRQRKRYLQRQARKQMRRHQK